MIPQERLKIETKLLLSAKRKSYMPRRSAQQQMTFSDLKWPFHASRAISVVAELLVNRCCRSFGTLSLISPRQTEPWTNDRQAAGSTPVRPLLCNNLRQVVHTLVPLSPSNYYYYYYKFVHMVHTW